MPRSMKNRAHAPASEQLHRLTVRIPEDIVKKVKHVSRERGQNISTIVANALQQHLVEETPSPDKTSIHSAVLRKLKRNRQVGPSPTLRMGRVGSWLSRREETPMLTETQRNNEFYESNEAELERQYKGRFVLIANGRLVGAYDDADAAGKAIRSLNPRPAQAVLTKIAEDKRELGEWLAGSLEP